MSEIETKIEDRIEILHRDLEMVKNEIRRVIVGQKELIDRLMMTIICRGHLLLEGYPGLAKTLLIQTLSQILDIQFKRIQFTPDLLPSDLIGSLIYNQQTGEFSPEKGPVFTNFLMADEINRAPAKVQSALLECMQERKVTIGRHTYVLKEPFFVMATQNPIEHEGTFDLPEAQKDRFMFKTTVSYPARDEELQIINKIALSKVPEVRTLVDGSHLENWQTLSREIFVDEKIKQYALEIVFATRSPSNPNIRHIRNHIKLGVSPRASIYMIMAGQARAFMEKRAFVIPEDIHAVSRDILQHRIILSYEAMAESVTTSDIVDEILLKTRVP